MNLSKADNESEQEVPPDMGESLMMIRTMIILLAKEDVEEKGIDNSWLRTNIF